MSQSIDTAAVGPESASTDPLSLSPQKSRRALLWSRIAGIGVGTLLLLDVASRLMLNSMESPLRWAPKDWAVYGLGLAWSVSTWFAMPIVLRPLLTATWRKRLVAGVSALWLAIVLLATFAFRIFTEQSPSWQALRFLVDKPDHAYELGRQWLGWLPLVATLATIVGLYFVGTTLLEGAPQRPRKKRWRALIVVVYATLTVMLCLVPGMQSPLPIEALGMTSFGSFGVATFYGERHLVTPVRPPLPPARETDPPSILLLFHESLSADAVFPGLDYKGRFDVRKTSPFTSTLLGRESEGFFVLTRARANATATESSVPTVLSGVDLGGATDAYGTAQSIWSLGKATKASTFLFSSCSYNWSHFDEFFIDKNVDYHRTGLELGPRIVNDSGVDDRLMVDASLTYLRRLIADKKRFVGVLHFDATHLPGYWGPGTDKIKAPHDERYPKAAAYVDKMNEDLVGEILSSSARDNTIIIATSDHGEQIPPMREPNRLGNYYEPTVRIPVWLYVPPKLLEKHPEYRAQLLAWKERNAQNMDVLPTVRDFLTFPREASLDLPGHSWVAPPPAVDQMAGQSTTSFRAWNNEGFFVVRERLKIIVSSETEKPEIYDLSKDPEEKHDLWGNDAVRTSVEPWVRELVRTGQERRILCKRLGETRCPYM